MFQSGTKTVAKIHCEMVNICRHSNRLDEKGESGDLWFLGLESGFAYGNGNALAIGHK